MKNIDEKILMAEEEIKQLQNQKRQLKKKLNEQERKARNKRLIEKGAVFESIFEESKDLTKDESNNYKTHENHQMKMMNYYKSQVLSPNKQYKNMV